MLDKLKQVEDRYEELCARAEQPDFYADPKKAAAWLREQKELAPIVTAYRAYCAAQRDMQDAAELMAGQADAEGLHVVQRIAALFNHFQRQLRHVVHHGTRAALHKRGAGRLAQNFALLVHQTRLDAGSAQIDAYVYHIVFLPSILVKIGIIRVFVKAVRARFDARLPPEKLLRGAVAHLLQAQVARRHLQHDGDVAPGMNGQKQ